jgi:hypothetical protein
MVNRAKIDKIMLLFILFIFGGKLFANYVSMSKKKKFGKFCLEGTAKK